MKCSTVIGIALLGLCCSTVVGRPAGDPIRQVIDLVVTLREKVRAQGQDDRKTYRKLKNWCDESENNAHFALVTAQRQNDKLEAEISKLTSDIETATSMVEKLATGLSKQEHDMKHLTQVRAKESETFKTGERELMEMTDALGRAMELLKAKGDAAALAQVDTASMNNVVHALGAVLKAASVPTSDRSKLLALVQSKDKASEDADEEADDTGAPSAASYTSKSGSILDILEDMKEESSEQLRELRMAETSAQHNFEVLKESLKRQRVQDVKEMGSQKHDKAKAKEDVAVAKSDLEVVTKDLKEAEKEHTTIQETCLEEASQQEITVASRDRELKVLWDAISILKKAAQKAASFTQVASTATLSSRSPVVGEVQRLANEEHSSVLAQLASHIASVMRHGASSGQDPFAKVKGLLKDMIKKTEREAAKDADEKEYCDGELEKTGLKEEDLNHDIHHLRAQLDTDQSKLTIIKHDLKFVGRKLAALAKEQADLDEIRNEQSEEFAKEKAELDTALSGVARALKVLKEYYDNNSGEETSQDDSTFAALMQQPARPQQHTPETGAGGQIISMLEGIKEDLSEGVSTLESSEDRHKEEYERMTAESKIEVAGLQENLEYSGTQKKGKQTEVTEIKEEEDTSETELSAVDEYLIKLKKRCQAKPDSYEERKTRKLRRIEGLEKALEILEEEAGEQASAPPAFLQRLRSHRGLRGNSVLDVAAVQ